MGNCLRSMIEIEKYPLVENSDSIIHLIECNKESIINLNQRLATLEKNINQNTKNMGEDIIFLNEQFSKMKIPQNELTHHSSSKYGGLSSESTHEELDEGPLFSSAKTSW